MLIASLALERLTMIPNALATTGVQAKVWSHLKSIEHSLARALDPKVQQLTDLDRDRLVALASELKAWCVTIADEAQAGMRLTQEASPNESLHFAIVDARSTLKNIAIFDHWRRPSRLSFERKLSLLVAALQYFVERWPNSFFTKKEVPDEEFRILHAILGSLLKDAESAIGSTERW